MGRSKAEYGAGGGALQVAEPPRNTGQMIWRCLAQVMYLDGTVRVVTLEELCSLIGPVHSEMNTFHHCTHHFDDADLELGFTSLVQTKF